MVLLPHCLAFEVRHTLSHESWTHCGPDYAKNQPKPLSRDQHTGVCIKVQEATVVWLQKISKSEDLSSEAPTQICENSDFAGTVSSCP